MPATAPTRRPRTSRPGDDVHGRPWRVVVLNDDHNTFEGVAIALSRTLPGVGYDQGLELANRIHFSGRAVVYTGPKETAEHYHAGLGAYGLTMAPLQQC